MCPVCEREQFAAAAVAGLSLRRCLGCGLHLSDAASPGTTSYASVDARAYVRSIGAIRRQQGDVIAAEVRRQLAGGEWLDVGCGLGFAVEAARAAGYDARGLEPDRVAADAARQRGLDVKTGTLSEATRPADVVSTLDVLEHLEDINTFGRLVRKKARKLWAIKVPSSDGLFFRIAHALQVSSAVRRLWQSTYEHPHRVYFNEASLRAFVEKHGFVVTATRHLEEVSTSTIVDRLVLDGGLARWRASLAVPAVGAVNALERLRGRSDALLMIARPGDAA